MSTTEAESREEDSRALHQYNLTSSITMVHEQAALPTHTGGAPMRYGYRQHTVRAKKGEANSHNLHTYSTVLERERERERER